jgi:thioredoxin reductase
MPRVAFPVREVTKMPDSTDVAIVGAGPYGLSIAAHLRTTGLTYRIVGSPMHFWQAQMPKGMLLKSEGFASNLFDPGKLFPLAQFCAEQGLPYADVGLPVPLETFSAYGLAFQRRFVSGLEDNELLALERASAGFLLRLKSGEAFLARRVLLAIGIGYFSHIPKELADLPAEALSHSSEHGNLDQFRGRDVTVVGAGASAIDLAALLHEGGANVRLVARRSSIQVHGMMQLPRPLWERVRRPLAGIGPGWRYVVITDAPLLVHYLPAAARLMLVKRILGPAAGWFMKDPIARVPLMLGCSVKRAEMSGGRVNLQVVGSDGTESKVTTDHVIAATGFRVDLRRLPFLSKELLSQLRCIEGAPVLSSHFQSSVPGLYFAGAAAANSFGPVMRFAVGARFTARRISRHLAATS